MSAESCWDALAEVLAGVDGIQAVLLGEPSAAETSPILYGALAGFERSQSGHVTGMRYSFTLRLVIDWGEPATAERILLSLLNRIPAAIDADPTLGATITMGLAKVTTGTAGFIRIGSTLARICDFTADVLEKGAYQGGL